MAITNILKNFPKESLLGLKPRPYFNHSVEFKHPFTAEDRAEVLEKVGFNVFAFPSEMITGMDMLSDSGTDRHDNSEQWAL
ncbi:hypothetical protein HZC20_01370 [Candidatus Peregrinibacteria bacterium]|nr:hypothetical protein [Candidatus Peregrinibacteria bacterium]